MVNAMRHAQPTQLAQTEVFLLEKALNAFREATGVVGRVVLMEPVVEQGVRADALIELEIGRQMAHIKPPDPEIHGIRAALDSSKKRRPISRRR